MGFAWADKIVAAGALAGIVTSLMGSLLGQARIYVTLGRQHLLPPWLVRARQMQAAQELVAMHAHINGSLSLPLSLIAVCQCMRSNSPRCAANHTVHPITGVLVVCRDNGSAGPCGPWQRHTTKRNIHHHVSHLLSLHDTPVPPTLIFLTHAAAPTVSLVLQLARGEPSWGVVPS